MDDTGQEIAGPAFEPYTAILARESPKYALIEAKQAWLRSQPPVRADRLLWWNDPKVNPLFLYSQPDATLLNTAIAQHNEELYRGEFERGRADAIFEYVDRHPSGFNASWVVAVKEKWGRESSVASLSKLLKTYLRADRRRGVGRGRPRGSTPWKAILADVRIFLKMWDFAPDDYTVKLDARIAEALPMERAGSGYRVWNTYKPYVDSFTKQYGGSCAPIDFLRTVLTR